MSSSKVKSTSENFVSGRSDFLESECWHAVSNLLHGILNFELSSHILIRLSGQFYFASRLFVRSFCILRDMSVFESHYFFP